MRKDVGEQLGNYRLLRLLGEGGQASVYLGEHVYLGSQAALKVRHAVLTNEEQTVFLQEAQTLVRLSHPHIVRVLDFAVEDGLPFLVMEYAPHGSLRQLHPKGTRLPLNVLISYVHQVALALQYTHDQGLIHRDVKPENLLLRSHDQVLLSDFGLVLLAPQLLSSDATEPMEQSLVGTTSYLAPEQLRGKAQPASDQYSLGIVVYEWLCGKPPFQGQFLEAAVQHVSSPPPSLREQLPHLSPAIEEVVLRALAKEPEQRFPSVQDFATALEHAYQQEASPRLTPVLAPDHEAETGRKPSSLRQLPTGTVTLLFTDMEGSTHLLQQLGDRYASVLSECRHLLRTAFQRWGGHEVDTQGDSFFVAFARATDAISAAIEAQRAIARHAWPQGTAVRVRMGLHTGEPSLTSEGYVGLDVHRAARIMSAGHGGQVLLSQATSTLVEHDLPDDVSLRDLGEYRLKDLGRREHLFQVAISDLPADFPPLKTLDTSPNNLPIQPTPFVGREQEVTTARDLLLREDVRLLTLTGPGGIGKTRLSLQVAADLSDRFADGVFFVNLAPIREPESVLAAIAQALAVKETTEHSLLELLQAFLREKQVLLLLDNFEQVVSAASQVADLLAACPKLKILVTSREVLHVQAEHEFAVPFLVSPDPKCLPDLTTLSHYAAVALFLQRAQAVKPDFQITSATAGSIAEICARLEGLPLAIELAAARMKLFPPQALLARLSPRLQVLTSTARDVPTRQQTLRNTIEWSYHLLDAAEQRLFRCLSVFIGGCTLEAAEAVRYSVGDSGIDVLNVVTALLDKNLLLQSEQVDGEIRLVMLETIREYGLEALVTSGEMETTQQAHALYYLRLSEEAEPHLDGPQQVVWLERLERDHGNLRASLRWSMDQGKMRGLWEFALRLAVSLRRFWMICSYWSEGSSFFEQILSGSEGVVGSQRARALSAAATLADYQGDYRQGESLCQESLAIWRTLRDTRGIAFSLYRLASMSSERGNFSSARSLYEEALTLFKELNDQERISWSLVRLAGLESMQGEHTRARQLFEESLTHFRQLRNKEGVAWTLFNLAWALFVAQHDPVIVRSLLAESLALCKELSARDSIASCLFYSGMVALNQRAVATARSLIEESVALNRELGNQRAVSQSLYGLASTLAVQGDTAAARALYKATSMSG